MTGMSMSDPPRHSGGNAASNNGEHFNNTFSGEMHPLRNPVILANLFDLCPPSILALSRLVCRQWLDISLASWRSSASLLLYSHEDPNRLIFARMLMPPFVPGENATISPIRQLLDFAENPRHNYDAKPFRRIHLKGFHFNLDDKLVDSFWKLVGETTLSLKLTNCIFNLDNFRFIIYQACPNLRELALINCSFPLFSSYSIIDPMKYVGPICGEHKNLKSISFEGGFPSIDLHVCWLELLSHFPALTSIQLKDAKYATPSDIKRLFDAVKTIREHDPRKLPLKHVDIRPASAMRADEAVGVSCEIFSMLQELHIPIQSVRLCFNNDFGTRFIENVVTFHGKTLRRIEAVRTSTQPSRLLGFPFGVKMECLQELIIQDLACENMTFLKYAPNLQKLHIIRKLDVGRDDDVGNQMVSNTLEHEMGNVKLVKLTDLRLDVIVTEGDLERLVGWLPNVRILKMTLNDKQFQVICEYWRDIVDLHDNGSELTDEGLLGMEGNCANITFLQNLRVFRSESNKITEVSAHHGFAQLPNLLHMTYSKEINDPASRLEKRVSRAPPSPFPVPTVQMPI